MLVLSRYRCAGCPLTGVRRFDQLASCAAIFPHPFLARLWLTAGIAKLMLLFQLDLPNRLLGLAFTGHGFPVPGSRTVRKFEARGLKNS
jgi:hypothetical protein